MKPQKKRNIGIRTVVSDVITFNTDEKFAKLLVPYGHLCTHENPTRYSLTIDARYDMDDVKAYIDELNEGGVEP